MFSIGIMMIYLFCGGFIAVMLYRVYRVLLAILDKYLYAKNDHTAAVREQNEVLKEIATAIRASKDNNGTPPETILNHLDKTTTVYKTYKHNNRYGHHSF